jgi:hypothetical protein
VQVGGAVPDRLLGLGESAFDPAQLHGRRRHGGRTRRRQPVSASERTPVMTSRSHYWSVRCARPAWAAGQFFAEASLPLLAANGRGGATDRPGTHTLVHGSHRRASNERGANS